MATRSAVVVPGDMNIIGAKVNARQVNADVGGNLNIASIPDTMHSDAHQTSTGGAFLSARAAAARASATRMRAPMAATRG
ncbi:hemagglutinin repeat-containing protein [Paraburkholderia caledonica]|uniref:hemagglutinin repeat-containing protein n=1 Tax=Paraburkholderia caledonica TaxID=134536 RepID=UPI0040427B64